MLTTRLVILLQDFLAIDAAVVEFTAAYQREPVRFSTMRFLLIGQNRSIL